MKSRPDQGAALLVVILLVALLSVMVVEFQREARVEIKSAENLADDLQSHALLRSGADLTEQLLAIYDKNEVADLSAARRQVKGGDLLWQFLFLGETVAIPVPSAVLTAEANLRGRLEDLYGRFPLGALVGPQTDARRTLFKDYLVRVKEYLGSKGESPLEAVDASGLAETLIDYLESEGGGDVSPIHRLTDLSRVDGFTPTVVRALAPYLDTRAEWKFNVNSRCVPLILIMGDKTTIEDAQQLAQDLREEPVSATTQIGSVGAEFANSLTIKSARFQATLEASVRGGARRARVVFGRKVDPAGVPQGRFRLEEWVEGWVEGLDDAQPADETEGAEPQAQTESGGGESQ